MPIRVKVVIFVHQKRRTMINKSNNHYYLFFSGQPQNLQFVLAVHLAQNALILMAIVFLEIVTIPAICAHCVPYFT